MAEDLKAEYKRIQEKKRPKNEDTIEVDEFEWVQVTTSIALPFFRFTLFFSISFISLVNFFK